MRYSRSTLNYLERIKLFDPTHMMSMTDLVAIIDSGCSLEREFIELIRLNP